MAEEVQFNEMVVWLLRVKYKWLQGQKILG